MKKYVIPIVNVVRINPISVLVESLRVSDTPTNDMLSKRGSYLYYYDEDENEEDY